MGVTKHFQMLYRETEQRTEALDSGYTADEIDTLHECTRCGCLTRRDEVSHTNLCTWCLDDIFNGPG